MSDTNLLLTPFPPEAIKKRPQAGKFFSYVDGGDVQRRLIGATGNNFSWRVNRLEFVSDGKVGFWLCEGTLEIPGLGSRTGVGTDTATTHESPKSAETDALKRAAVHFGVALHLYEDHEAAAPVPSARPSLPPVQKVHPNQANAEALEARVRAELGTMGVTDRREQATVMVAIYGQRPEKWTAPVFQSILNAPGAVWREAVDRITSLPALPAEGTKREYEPT